MDTKSDQEQLKKHLETSHTERFYMLMELIRTAKKLNPNSVSEPPKRLINLEKPK